MSESIREVPGLAWDVAERFGGGRRPHALELVGSGHIHHTVRARFEDAPDLALQQLNVHVFPDLALLATNARRVTAHLREKARARAVADLDRRVLRPVAAGLDEIVVDDRGEHWRAWVFVERTHAYDVVVEDALAERGAEAFGAFAADLSDLEPARVGATIDGFHDTGARLHSLERAFEADAHGRAAAVEADVETILELGRRILGAIPSGQVGGAGGRLVHNDCKINNLLFDDETDDPLCVVDLDTVMPGSLAIDFGGLVRSASCSAAEDEEDVDRMRSDAGRLRALARGYLRGLGDAVTTEELAVLPMGGCWMAIEDASRFLTDHIEGDHYFPALRPGHNRIRARAQCSLARHLWDERAGIEATIAELRRQLSGID